MKNAKIIVARYKKGIMSKDQVLNYIASAMHARLDAEAIAYILKNID